MKLLQHHTSRNERKEMMKEEYADYRNATKGKEGVTAVTME